MPISINVDIFNLERCDLVTRFVLYKKVKNKNKKKSRMLICEKYDQSYNRNLLIKYK